MNPYVIGGRLQVNDIPLIPKPGSALVNSGGIVSEVGIDYTVKKNSNNLVTSGAVFKAISEGIEQTVAGMLPDSSPVDPGSGGSGLYSKLMELEDVETPITNKPLAGQILMWQGGNYPTGQWEFESIPAASTLNSIGDVEAASPAEGYALVWTSNYQSTGQARWYPSNAASSHELYNHLNVVAGDSAIGDVKAAWSGYKRNATGSSGGANVNSVLMLTDHTSYDEWTFVDLEDIMDNHSHVYTDITNWNTGNYNWAFTNLVQGDGMTLIKNGTTVTFRNDITRLDQMADIDFTGVNEPVSGEVLMYQGIYGGSPEGKWISQSIPAPSSINQIGDVETAAPVNGYVLTWTDNYQGGGQGRWVPASGAAQHEIYNHLNVVPGSSIVGAIRSGWESYLIDASGSGGTGVQNGILIMTNKTGADEWTFVDLADIIENHTHTYTEISNWNTGNYAWANTNLVQGTGMTLTKNGTTVTFTNTITTLNALTDVIAPSPVSGQVLMWQGGDHWEPQNVPGPATLISITDVKNDAQVDGYFLSWEQSELKWIARAGGSTHQIENHNQVNYTKNGSLSSKFDQYADVTLTGGAGTGGGNGVNHILMLTDHTTYDEWAFVDLDAVLDNYVSYWTESSGNIRRATGNVGVGSSSAPGAKFHVSNSTGTIASGLILTGDANSAIATMDGTYGGWTGITAGNDSTYRPTFAGNRARGTLSTPTALQSGDEVFAFLGRAYDGASLQTTIQIKGIMDSNASTGVTPARLSFLTTETNYAGLTERMTIKSDGKIGINNTSPQYPIHFNESGGTLNAALIRSTGTWMTTGEGPYIELGLQVASDTATDRGFFSMFKSAGTLASPTKVNNGDYMGNIVAGGYDGTTIRATASLDFRVDGVTASSQIPGMVIIRTGETTSRTDRWRVRANGDVDHLASWDDTEGISFSVNGSDNNTGGVMFFKEQGALYGGKFGYDGAGRVYIGVHNNSGTMSERISVLRSNGYVGINKTNPGMELDVDGTIRRLGSGAILSRQQTVSVAQTLFSIQDSNGATRAYMQIDANNYPNLYMRTTSGTNAIFFNTNSADDNYFNAGSTAFGKTTADHTVDVNGTVNANILSLKNEAEGVITYDTINDTLDFLAGAEIYFDPLDNHGYAGDWSAYSDATLKTNITYSTKDWLPVISAIGRKVANFEWKDSLHGEGVQLGFIAQDIEGLLPEVVSVGSKGKYGLAYGKMVTPLYSGMADLIKENDILKEKVERLENEIHNIKKQRYADNT